jgi:hypothetical protein
LLLLFSLYSPATAQATPPSRGSAIDVPTQDAAIALDGIQDGWVIDGFQYASQTPLTVEAWLHVSADSKGDIISMAERGGFALQMIYGQFWFSMHDGKRFVRVKSRALERFGMLHVAGVFDGKNLQIFLNGVPSASPVSFTGQYRESRVPLTIACGTKGRQHERFFRGGIASLRISSCARYSDAFTPPATLTRDDQALLTLQFDNTDNTDAFSQQIEAPLVIRSTADRKNH